MVKSLRQVPGDCNIIMHFRGMAIDQVIINPYSIKYKC
jgi:hypothetical protein